MNRVYDAVVPVAQRSSRAELIRSVENFSDAWQYKDGDLIPEAGSSPDHGDANSPLQPKTPADPSIGRPPLQGPWIRDRRYPIVDVERGVVLAYHIQGGSPTRPTWRAFSRYLTAS